MRQQPQFILVTPTPNCFHSNICPVPTASRAWNSGTEIASAGLFPTLEEERKNSLEEEWRLGGGGGSELELPTRRWPHPGIPVSSLLTTEANYGKALKMLQDTYGDGDPNLLGIVRLETPFPLTSQGPEFGIVLKTRIRIR